MFPGGCFFASVAAEIDTHPGPVRDRALATVADWFNQLETAVTEAQADHTLDPDEDPTQIAFEFDAYLLLANAQYVATGDPAALDRSRRAIDRLLQSIAPATTSRWSGSNHIDFVLGSPERWFRAGALPLFAEVVGRQSRGLRTR